MHQRAMGAMILVLALSSLAGADEWKKNYQVSGKPELKVDSGDGNIRVSSWTRNEIQAEVFTEGWKIGADAVRITERQTANRVEIEIHIPHGGWNFGGRRSVRVEVMVPKEGNLDLHTGDGSIEVQEVKGDSRFNTGDGNLEVRNYDGALRARTGDGSIRLMGRFDVLDLQTGDGNIDGEVQSGSKIASEWSLRTSDGSIELRLPANLAADVDAHTGDGRISSDLPITVGGISSQSQLRGKLNGGGGILELRTGDGNITLRKGL